MVRSLLIACCVLLAALPAFAIDELELQHESEQVYESVMSPFCPGRTLNNCPSSGAIDLKTEIRERISAGEGPEEVIDSLVEKYGNNLRAAPKNEGFGRVAWIAPLVFALIGLWAVISWLASHRARQQPEAPAEVDPDVQARIDSELEKM